MPASEHEDEQPGTAHDREPDGFLFVCRTVRAQAKRGGNVAVAWWNDAEQPDDPDAR